MIAELPLWHQVVLVVGQITILLVLAIILTAILLVTLSLYTIKTGKLLFPGFLKAGMVMLEGVVKSLYRLLGIEDREILALFISVHNTLNKKAFEKIPVSKRAIFLPQCLRSARCPAHLTPEGLKCRACGSCSIGGVLISLEEMGYRIFIVPGSSFIKRMVKQYHPQAIIGVGCLSEVKEGLEMVDKVGLVGMGVVTTKEGCVETSVNWEDVIEVAILGVPPDEVPPSIKERSYFPGG
jgi:hypothetical protein